MVGLKNKKFVYKNSIKWQGQKKGLLTSVDKSNLEVATPVEFKGHAGFWSPEDLFVASVNSCIFTTFLHYAEKENLELLHYESEAVGILERSENKFLFSEIKVMPKICIKTEGKLEKVKAIIRLSEKNCLISNSIKSKVEVIPQIEEIKNG